MSRKRKEINVEIRFQLPPPITKTGQRGGRAVLSNASQVAVFPHERKPVIFIEFPGLSHYQAKNQSWHLNRTTQQVRLMRMLYCLLGKYRHQRHGDLVPDLSERFDLVSGVY